MKKGLVGIDSIGSEANIVAHLRGDCTAHYTTVAIVQSAQANTPIGHFAEADKTRWAQARRIVQFGRDSLGL